MSMPGPDHTAARDSLAMAREAQHQGSRAGARPAWYPVALGLSVTLALASFAVPSLTLTGMVLGAVVLPVLLETVVRRTSGVSPRKDYLARHLRAPALTWVVVVGGVAVAALVRLKVTGAVDGVLAAAVVAGVVTTACTWWVSRRRDAGPARAVTA